MIFLRNFFIIFAALALTLLGIPITAIHSQTQIQANAPTELTNPLAAIPLDRLSATGERPLFAPNRRSESPPPPPVLMSPPPPVPPNVVLLGVVIDDSEARAIVQVGSGNEMLRVRLGDDISGWKVVQIESRQLVLSLDGRLATVTMFQHPQ